MVGVLRAYMLQNIGGTLEGRQVLLKVLKPSDVSEAYVSWLNDPIVNKYLETRYGTLSDVKEYVESKLKSDSAILWGIFWKDGKHIGNIKLEPIDFGKKVATVGILIGDKEYWGRGVATESIELISNYAFEMLHLEKIILGVMKENASAIHVYKKCGFSIVEVQNGAINHNGILHDQILMEKVHS